MEIFNVNPAWILMGEGDPFQKDVRKLDVDPEVLEIAQMLQGEIDRVAEEVAQQILEEFSQRVFESAVLRPTLTHRIKVYLLEKAKERKASRNPSSGEP